MPQHRPGLAPGFFSHRLFETRFADLAARLLHDYTV